MTIEEYQAKSKDCFIAQIDNFDPRHSSAVPDGAADCRSARDRPNGPVRSHRGRRAGDFYFPVLLRRQLDTWLLSNRTKSLFVVPAVAPSAPRLWVSSRP